MTGARPRHVAVIDIGKTNAKLVAVDLATLEQTVARQMPNTVRTDGLYPHFDADALWGFIEEGLVALAKESPVDAVSVTTHGAAGAVLDGQGPLALPLLDYEHDGPENLANDYDALRPPFSETGSPRLAGGLNLGAQFFWQQKTFPELWARARTLLTYPQFWGHRLTGARASDWCSLGAHTDLWKPGERRFSPLVEKLGWTAMMAPVRAPGEVLGPLRIDLARRLGLKPGAPVFCGIHDSNASLYPHLLVRDAPFSVVSTGTWVIVLSLGDGTPKTLDPARDTLMNVNASGDPVASARFMGGREYQLLTEGLSGAATQADADSVLKDGVMLMPSVHENSGPFPGLAHEWLPEKPTAPGKVLAAASFYLAAMTATSLRLTGAAGPVVVEGPFARNALYVRMLRATVGRPVLASPGGTGASLGAALLADPAAAKGPSSGGDQEIADPGPLWADWFRRWSARAEARRS
ncbi:MAG TPA: FGGY family carbohydrate kinase [Mesorhizobium sp.]|jgi:sugar (pentulose or hexulose) kinase|nr:FGGY family carbohydrate kinase [Mesorhizobium sp.]